MPLGSRRPSANRALAQERAQPCGLLGTYEDDVVMDATAQLGDLLWKVILAGVVCTLSRTLNNTNPCNAFLQAPLPLCALHVRLGNTIRAREVARNTVPLEVAHQTLSPEFPRCLRTLKDSSLPHSTFGAWPHCIHSPVERTKISLSLHVGRRSVLAPRNSFPTVSLCLSNRLQVLPAKLSPGCRRHPSTARSTLFTSGGASVLALRSLTVKSSVSFRTGYKCSQRSYHQGAAVTLLRFGCTVCSRFWQRVELGMFFFPETPLVLPRIYGWDRRELHNQPEASTFCRARQLLAVRILGCLRLASNARVASSSNSVSPDSKGHSDTSSHEFADGAPHVCSLSLGWPSAG